MAARHGDQLPRKQPSDQFVGIGRAWISMKRKSDMREDPCDRTEKDAFPHVDLRETEKNEIPIAQIGHVWLLQKPGEDI